MKKLYTIILLLFTPMFLAGCQSMTNDGSFFQSTFVNPFAWLIHFFASITGGSFGFAIIFITIIED